MNSDRRDQLLNKIRGKTAVCGVVGLGYVGLPLLLSIAEAGFQSIGFDIDMHKVNALNNAESYLSHIDSDRIKSMKEEQRLDATSDFSRVSDVDVLILCVPTPLNKYREPDLSFIRITMDSILPHLRKGQLVSLESTTYPGTTEEELHIKMESIGFNIGHDFFLAYSPEREDPGNQIFTTRSIPKIVSGSTPACLEVANAIYGTVFEKIIPVSSTKTAELAKLLENIFRFVNIGLVNEMKIIADRMGIDIWEVIDAAATKPFGFTPFYPGPGLGGHCIPIDPFYLTWKAREYESITRFTELAGEINALMPEWTLNKISDALNDLGKSLKNSKILVLGLAYKKNVDDARESPAIKLIKLLMQKGTLVFYSDPYIPFFPKMNSIDVSMVSLVVTQALLMSVDAVVIVTDHDQFDYDLILKYAPLIIDTRGRFKGIHKNVVKA